VQALQLKWRSIFKTNSQFWEVPLGKYFQMLVFPNFDAFWFHKRLHISQISLRFESAILYDFDVGSCYFDVLTVSEILKITINPLIYILYWKYRLCRYSCTCVLIDLAQQLVTTNSVMKHSLCRIRHTGYPYNCLYTSKSDYSIAKITPLALHLLQVSCSCQKDVPVYAGFLYNLAAMLRDRMRRTSCILLCLC